LDSTSVALSLGGAVSHPISLYPSPSTSLSLSASPLKRDTVLNMNTQKFRCFQALFHCKRFLHVEERLAKLGYILPPAPKPAANYTPLVRTGNLLYLAGHIPINAQGSLVVGRLGENMSLEEGKEAAKLAGLGMISTLKSNLGDLDKVRRIVKVQGFVNSVSNFTSHHLVMNGCSDLLGEVFGDPIGVHARSALGTGTLPLGIPVEVEAIVEIRGEKETN